MMMLMLLFALKQTVYNSQQQNIKTRAPLDQICNHYNEDIKSKKLPTNTFIQLHIRSTYVRIYVCTELRWWFPSALSLVWELEEQKLNKWFPPFHLYGLSMESVCLCLLTLFSLLYGEFLSVWLLN